jgi:hypothetical protein
MAECTMKKWCLVGGSRSLGNVPLMVYLVPRQLPLWLSLLPGHHEVGSFDPPSAFHHYVWPHFRPHWWGQVTMDWNLWAKIYLSSLKSFLSGILSHWQKVDWHAIILFYFLDWMSTSFLQMDVASMGDGLYDGSQMTPSSWYVHPYQVPPALNQGLLLVCDQ